MSVMCFQSLINWDSSRPDSLLCVVRELIEQYRIYQQKLLSTVSRLQFEYNSLLENNEGLKLTAADVEVHVLMKDVCRKYYHLQVKK